MKISCSALVQKYNQPVYMLLTDWPGGPGDPVNKRGVLSDTDCSDLFGTFCLTPNVPYVYRIFICN